VRLAFAALYLALACAANAADLSGVPLDGDMAKLVVHDTPVDLPEIAVTTPGGETVTLQDYAGQPVLLNWWATWCAPCREEMPALDAVQRQGMVEVVTVATGRNTVPGIEAFFEAEGVGALPILLDPDQSAAQSMEVWGLPVTILIDSEGREVARLTGAADWAGPEAAAVLGALSGAGG
jgi:thiol-disulfide isomerase/thioredoxin